MRTAISPRLATKTFSNIPYCDPFTVQSGQILLRRLAELDRFAVFDENLRDDAFGFDAVTVHHLHNDASMMQTTGFDADFCTDFAVRGGFQGKVSDKTFQSSAT